MGRFSPPQAGLYTIKAQLVENPRTESEDAEGLLLFGSVGQPIIVISVDSIKRPVPSGPFPFSGWGSQKPMPKASQILRQLAETYQMIYIESGNNLKHLLTRDWLDREDFPKAPLFVLSPTDDPEERTEQTIRELEKCQGAGAFFMGITRSADEAKAFKTMGMRVVVLSEDEENKFPKGTQVIKKWEGVPL